MQVRTGDFSAASVQRVQAQFLQNTASNQQASAVCCGIVGQTNFDSVFRQLVRVSGADDFVALNARVSDLSGDIAVRQANDQPVLWRIVLVLVLEDQAFSRIVIGLSLTTPLELDLVTLEVLFVLNNFHESL